MASAPNTWGKALWDQERPIAVHTEAAIETTNRVRQFIASFAQIQINFGKEIRKLARQYVDLQKKADTSESTASKVALTMMLETDDIGKQHESIGEELSAGTVEVLKNIGKDYKADRQRHLNDLAVHQAELEKVKKKHDGAKKQFDKAAKDALEAAQKHDKADKDENLVKSKIEKLRVERDKLGLEAESTKRELTLVTDQLNHAQQEFYHGHVVEVFDAIEKLEIKRIGDVAEQIRAYVRCTRVVLPIITTCLTNIDAAVNAVDGAADSMLFLEANMTGLRPPDINSAPSDAFSPMTALSVHEINKKRVEKTKLFHTTTRKKDAVREDFGHLPPEQRKKALVKKVAELEEEERKDTKTMEALNKTVELYTTNPNMGDVKAKERAQKEAQLLNEKLRTKTQPQIFKFKLYLSALEGGPPPEMPAGHEDDEELYNFDDYDDEDPGHAAAAGTPPHAAAAYASAPASAALPPPPPPSLALPMARVLYPFEGGKESELPVKAGDVVEIIENDNSGWLRARLQGREGYVPLSYVELL